MNLNRFQGSGGMIWMVNSVEGASAIYPYAPSLYSIFDQE